MSVVPSDAQPCGVLVLDSTGMVVAANGTARELWGATERTLVSESFTQLVSADATAPDPECAHAAWTALKAATVDRSAELIARRRNGSSFGIRVRLERSLGGAGTFIATISPA